MTEALAFILPLSHRHLFLCLWASHQDLSPGCTFSLFLNHLSVYKWASHEDLSSRCTLLCSQTICLCTSEHLTRTCHLAVHSPLIPNHLCTSEHLITTCHLAVHSPLIQNHLCTSEHLTRTCHLAVHSSVPQPSACLHTTGCSTGLPTHLYTPLFPNHFLFCVQEGIPQSPGSAMLHESSLLPCCKSL